MKLSFLCISAAGGKFFYNPKARVIAAGYRHKRKGWVTVAANDNPLFHGHASRLPLNAGETAGAIGNAA